MSYIVTFDQSMLDRSVADAINRAVRHCRIGKVRPKRWQQPIIPAMPYVGDFPRYLPSVPSIATPNTAQPIQWWQNPVCSIC